MRTLIAMVVLALLAGLVVIGVRTGGPVMASGSEASRDSSFEVRVERPRSARPLFGVLPTALEARLLEDPDLGFDSSSRGAKIGGVGHDRLELSADGWELAVETDGEGHIALGTQLVFPLVLASEKRE